MRSIDLGGLNYTLIADELTNAVALDFDWDGMKIYWSDVTQQDSRISVMNMDGTNRTVGMPAGSNKSGLHGSSYHGIWYWFKSENFPPPKHSTCN